MLKKRFLSLFLCFVLIVSGILFTNPKAKVDTSIIDNSGGVKIVNNNKPSFTKKQKKKTKAFEKYSKLDKYGRCQVAFANICPELMPTEKRGEIGSVRPTGWHTVKYPGVIDDLYLYNRCHLIAFCLAGENANKKNLITGTRQMNVEYMLPYEMKVLDYVRSTGNHVLYRVTPLFKGKNLVASGVQMEAYSVEDKGKGVKFNVYCPNTQKGIKIDYKTGESSLKSDASVNVTTTENTTYNYVLNTNTRKIHLPTCASVHQMKDKNKKYSTESIEALEAQGYSPCHNCLSGYY